MTRSNDSVRRGVVRAKGGPDRLLAVFSDVEMGAGGPYDDFLRSDWLADVLCDYTEGPYRDLAVDLVFNGDTFDYLKTSFEGAYPHHVSARVALGKAARVAAAHPRFFKALGAFLAQKGERGRVFFVSIPCSGWMRRGPSSTTVASACST